MTGIVNLFENKRFTELWYRCTVPFFIFRDDVGDHLAAQPSSRSGQIRESSRNLHLYGYNNVEIIKTLFD